jgi:hypothetical protein
VLDGFQERDIQTQVELWLSLFDSCPDETAQNKEALTFLVDFSVVSRNEGIDRDRGWQGRGMGK